MNIFKLLDKKRAEVMIILLFILFLLFLKIGQPWNHSMSHTYPQFFNANDNFLHASLSEYVRDKGNYAFAPVYFSGGYDDVVGYIPPIIHHLSAMVSYLTGLETYDTIYLVVMFLTCFGYVLVYFAIKRVNKTLALLSLPFMIGVYSFTFEIAHAWGMSIFIIGSFFVFAFLWSMENFDRKYSFILIALFLSGMALGHTSELIFGMGFLIIYLAVKFFSRGLSKTEIKNVVLSLVIFSVVSVYYLIIFYFTWMKTNPLTFSVMESPTFAPNLPVNLSDFGLTQFLIYLGLLFFLFIFFLKEDSERLKINAMSPVILAGIFFLLMGFTNYIGFGIRAFQTRIFWPVYLAVFMGLAIYFIPAHFRRWRFRYAYGIAILLLVVFFFNHYGGLYGPGIIDQQVWNGFRWVSENTPEDSKIYHFYSRPVTQDYSLLSIKRVSYFVDLNDYTESFQNQVIKSEYKSRIAGLQDTHLPYRKSLFSYGYHAQESEFKDQVISMWDMDYYVFVMYDPLDSNNALIIYNGFVRDYMLNQTWMEESYSNSEVSILKNNEPGRRP